MSDEIKHECGIAVLRLLKPLSYYREKYGTPLYGLDKLYLLLEKQHNRGQDGAGVVNIKLNVEPGNKYFSRLRSVKSQPIQDVFGQINKPIAKLRRKFPEKFNDIDWLKQNVAFTGELFMGHLRYGTYGINGIESCHPLLRQNNWKSRNLAIAGNFNLTNVHELYNQLVSIGQHPKERSDTVTVLENIGHFLDEENEILFRRFNADGYSNKEISTLIGSELDLQSILKRASKQWDGGYVIGGLLGHGDAFVMRDPNGIRPAYFYHDDEIAVVASERPAIQTAFNLESNQLQEIKPGHALIIKLDGDIQQVSFRKPLKKKSCAFERIYFSRGTDVDIYKERKELGRLVCPNILEAIDYDLKHTVFSFIPNTAEVAFYGVVQGMDEYLQKVQNNKIQKLGSDINEESLHKILSIKTRIEKIAVKDVKLRTFITDDAHRTDLVTHVYDITYGSITPGVDNLVVIDDSIVRGTTLKMSILKMLERLGPKQIVVVSSAPQIRYPDCYGIDMAKLGDFVAFQAAIALIDDRNLEDLVDKVYHECKEQLTLPVAEMKNVVKQIYEPFTPEEVSNKISELLASDVNVPVKIIYQDIEGLHKACPDHTGDWYFSGDYPTPGGNKVVLRSFINYVEKRNERAY